MIEFYKNILIQISADNLGFHWEAYRGNKIILDSSKQGGFDSKKSGIISCPKTDRLVYRRLKS